MTKYILHDQVHFTLTALKHFKCKNKRKFLHFFAYETILKQPCTLFEVIIKTCFGKNKVLNLMEKIIQ